MDSYTESDFSSLYQTVRRELIQQANYDILKDNKYNTLLREVVLTLRKKKSGSSQYLNSLVLNSVIPKFTTMINKGKNSNAYNPPVNSPVNTLALPRPDFTKTQDYSPPRQNELREMGANIPNKKDMEDQFSRMCNQNSRDETRGMSSMDKFEELKRERGIAGANDDFNKMREQAERKTMQSLDSYNVAKRENNNDFFKNLYENKIAENSPFAESSNHQSPPLPPPEKVTINRSLVHEPVKSNQKQDPSTANELPGNRDKDISDLKQLNNLQEKYDQFKQESNDLYRNTNFTNTRENGKMIVLDTGNLAANAIIDFKATLIEPMIIDRIADVFIEFITIQNLRLSDSTAHLETVSLFALNIEELPTQIATTNANFLDKYIFPNETFGTSDIAGDGASADATTYTLKLKSNFYTSINAGKYAEFNVKLQGLVSDTLQNIESAGTGRVTIGLFVKKR